MCSVSRVSSTLTELCAAKIETPQSGSRGESDPARASPRERRVRHSERYVLGPASLAKFEPRISADLAGFNKGAEAQIARYKTDAGEAKLLSAFLPDSADRGRPLPGVLKAVRSTARRYGPMVGVVLDAGTPERQTNCCRPSPTSRTSPGANRFPKIEIPAK